ncbi:MAG TPA: DUF2865 domain-containing protein [Hyphomicrobiaceae bacterium]|nr:DUF2865 domain-containing protein [Hyphomicrobiaceae bacterium]
MRRNFSALAIWWVLVLAVVAVPVSASLSVQPAFAQFWKWPWEQDDARPPPRPAPSYDPRYDPRNAPPPSRGWQPQPSPPPAGGGGTGGSICLRLEQQLAQQANHGQNSAGQMAAIDEQVRQVRSALRKSQIRLDRGDCYETFLFAKSLKRTRTCIKLDREVETGQRQLQALDAQRRQLEGGGQRSVQDDIIRELARNNCGEAYVREARRRNPYRNFWQDEDTSDRIRGNTFAGLPFATYRTLCVRLCDGYYFPVSFSTLPTHFTRDSDACQARCAAPTELYFHQNPGGSIDQMVSQKTQEPYKSLRTAFKYRKEVVQGCSCKMTEYVPPGSQQAGGQPSPHGQTLPPQAAAARPQDKRDAMSPVR